MFSPPKPGYHVFHADKRRLFSTSKILYRYWYSYFDTVKLDTNEQNENNYLSNIKSFGKNLIRSLKITNILIMLFQKDVNIEIPYFETNIVGKFENLDGLTGLEYLTVRNFKLESDSLRHLRSLRNLHLFLCDLEHLTSESLDLERLPQLECFQIYRPLNYSHISLRNSSQLKWLRIKNLDSFSLLENLNYNLVVIEIVSSLNESNVGQILRNLNHDHLRVLHLLDNEFGHFDATWLAGLPNLRHLKLGANLIKTVDLSHDCLASLESLSLDHNKIESLDDAFGQLACLESLDLTSNTNLCLNPKVFNGLDNLKRLYLACVNRKKYISHLSRNFFTALDNLTVLDLKRNHLTGFDAELFDRLPNLRRLDLSENQLKRLNPDSFSHIGPNLEFLDLSLNEIETLPDYLFFSLRGLEILSLYFNPISDVRREHFKGLENLRKLCLRENCLEIVRRDAFAQMRRIEEIDLSGMNLSDLNRNELIKFYSENVNFIF